MKVGWNTAADVFDIEVCGLKDRSFTLEVVGGFRHCKSTEPA